MFYEGEFDNPEFLSISGNWYWYDNQLIEQLADLPFSKQDKITIVGPVGTHGYSILCKDIILKLREKGYLVNYLPHGDMDVDDDFYKSIYNFDFDIKQTNCYLVVMPPTLVVDTISKSIRYKNDDQKIFGCCLWDSEYIKYEYINILNDNFDALIVVSDWNRKSFSKCGINIPIYKLTYEPNLIELPDRHSSIEFIKKYSFAFGNQKDLSKTINFYTIGQWTNRKGISQTIETFCETFQNNENVSLIVKTLYKGYSQQDVKTCIERIIQITSKYKNCPSIYYVAGNLSSLGIFKIHSAGDIYLSLTRSEGIGLGALIAANYKRPVIITDYGAQREYLSKFENINYIKYSLVKAEDDLDFGMDLNKQFWAQADLIQAKNIMLDSFENLKNSVQSIREKEATALCLVGEFHSLETINANLSGRWTGSSIELLFNNPIKKLKINYKYLNSHKKLEVENKEYTNLPHEGSLEINCDNDFKSKIKCVSPVDNPFKMGSSKDKRNLGVFITSFEYIDIYDRYYSYPISQTGILPIEIATKFKYKTAKNNTYYHCGDLGDLIYALPVIKHTGGGKLFLGTETRLQIDKCVPREGLDKNKCDFLQSLLLSQDYISEVEYTDKYPDNVQYDLNKFRNFFIKSKNRFGLFPNGYNVNLVDAHLSAFEMDLSLKNEKWLSVTNKKIFNKKIVINRTERYQNINNESDEAYQYIVDNFNNDAVFVGTDIEYQKFVRRFGNVQRFIINSAEELAQLIDQCYIFVGNASFAFALSESMKKTSYLENYDNNLRHVKFPRENHYNLDICNVKKIRLPKIYHIVSLYEPKDKNTIHRLKIAKESWEIAYKNNDRIIPIHIYENDYPRNSQSIGDKRKCAFLLDLLNIAMDKCENDDDIVMITNDDTILSPFIGSKIFDKINRYQACKSFRLNLKNYKNFDSVELHDISEKDGGRDMFAMTKKWLKHHIAMIPDYVLGSTDWDLCLGLLIQFSNGINLNSERNDASCVTDIELGNVYHMNHDAAWRNLSVANNYNRRLTENFLIELKYINEFSGIDFYEYMNKKEN